MVPTSRAGLSNAYPQISGGQVSTVAGTGTAGATNGSVATARFNSPYSVDVGAGGKIYVADTKNHKLRLI